MMWLADVRTLHLRLRRVSVALPAVRVRGSADGEGVGRPLPHMAADRRHGSWCLRAELPVGLDGRRGGFTSKKAAEEALARLRAPSESGSELVTVGEWLTHWLTTRTGAASTISGHANHARLYLARPGHGGPGRSVGLAPAGDVRTRRPRTGEARKAADGSHPEPDYVDAAHRPQRRAPPGPDLRQSSRAGGVAACPASACGRVDRGAGRALETDGGNVRRSRCGPRRRPPSSSMPPVTTASTRPTISLPCAGCGAG